jgi:hypothetical protein
MQIIGHVNPPVVFIPRDWIYFAQQPVWAAAVTSSHISLGTVVKGGRGSCSQDLGSKVLFLPAAESVWARRREAEEASPKTQ